MNVYRYRVIEERNRLAAALGRPQRDLPLLSDSEKIIVSR
jgi:hypothetical protein